MIEIRHASDRGFANHGWLRAYHTFSFADYDEPKFRGFRTLRVINEDRISPGQGFAEHSHQDMEILTYVIKGKLQHKDSMGNGTVIMPGEVQYMSAGSGVTHSEFNASQEELVHLLQIWIRPQSKGEAPRYGQKNFLERLKIGDWALVASPDGALGSLSIRQDAKVFLGLAGPKQRSLKYHLTVGRYAWVQVIKGDLSVNGLPLSPGDGAQISELENIVLEAPQGSAEFLLFDLA